MVMSLPLHNETLKLLYATKSIIQHGKNRHVSNETVVYTALSEYYSNHTKPGVEKITRKVKQCKKTKKSKI